MNFESNKSLNLTANTDENTQVLVFFEVSLFVMLEIIGNGLLYCIIVYETCEIQSLKQMINNRLLSSICGMTIPFNTLIMPVFFYSIVIEPVGKFEHLIFID